jgi:tRNA dimethylallyltransferase
MMHEKKKLPLAIFIMGPTAAGKSALALNLAQRLSSHVISVDSALIYRGLDIGTAKPSSAIRAQIPHHLIDICDPSEQYSAARFRDDALACMQQSIAAGQVPLLVGGTMLYFRALQYGLAPLPEADPSTRHYLDQRLQQDGIQSLHQWLMEVDPEQAQRIHSHDPQRIQRALEVYLLTGTPLSVLWAQAQAQAFPYRVLKIIVAPASRLVLHQQIQNRLQSMLAQGFQQEVEALRARGDLHPQLPALRCVGYRQMWRYLDGQDDQRTMYDKILAATRQLARRQLTWLRKEPDSHWLDAQAPDISTAAWTLIQQAQASHC